MRVLLILILLPFVLFAQQEEFKLTFNHQALPVKKLQETGDFYIYILQVRQSWSLMAQEHSLNVHVIF